MEVLKPVFLFSFVVLVVNDVAEHRLDLLYSTEEGHVVTLRGSLLVLLLLQVEITLFVYAVDQVGLTRLENRLLFLLPKSSV